jgi:hypothetical protein
MGFEGIVSKRLSAPYRSGPSRGWIKVKNPDSPAMQRTREGRWSVSAASDRNAGSAACRHAKLPLEYGKNAGSRRALGRDGGMELGPLWVAMYPTRDRECQPATGFPRPCGHG